jgi:PAS domain S-box-containing protein
VIAPRDAGTRERATGRGRPARTARRFALAYAVGAALWVLLSDRLVRLAFDEPDRVAAVSLAKGWLFVAVSAAIFYFALKRARAAGDADDEVAEPVGSRARRRVVLALSAVVILGAGLAAIDYTSARQQQQELRRLQAVAALRADRVADWMAEHRREARTVTHDVDLAGHALRAVRGDDPESRATVLSILRAHRYGASYASVALVDAQGRASISDGYWGDAPDAPLLAAVRRALSTGEPVDSDLYLESARGVPVIDFVAPLAGPGAAHAIVLRTRADEALYRLVRSWPFESASGETHLVRRDGDDALSLSPLRFMPDSPLRLRLPLANSRLPGPRVLAGDQPPDAPLTGPDYRGVESIAWSVPVAGTAWVLVAKVDRAEFAAAARRDAVWIGLAALLFLAAVGFAVQMLHEQHTLRLTRALKQRQDEALRNASLLRNIVDSSTDAVFAKDADGRYVLLNAAAERTLGRERGAALGRRDEDLFPAAAASQIRASDLRIMEHGEVVTIDEPLATHGGRLALLTTKGPLRDADGRVSGVFGIARDVTERARVAAELDRHRNHLEDLVGQRTRELEAANAELQRRAAEVARLNEELARRATGAEAASRAKSAFLANMSHEIRTPLNAIVGLAYLVRRSHADGPEADRLARIVAASDHLLAVINDILDISKIEAGKLTLESEPLDVGTLMEQVGAWAAERAQQKEVELQVERAAGLPALVLGDATRLRQVLLNYASNAVKFTERGRISMRARLEAEDAEALVVRFVVEDTGPGVPADMQPRLFQAFEQGDDSTTRRYGGTGLGLAINRLIAHAMGGAVGVESAPGGGSRFWLTARLGKVVQPADGASPVVADDATELPDEDTLRRWWLGTRVLLVEDNPINREVAEELLAAIGLATDVAPDGAVALEKAGTAQYALILMDLQMPVMDGFEAMRAIRGLLGHAQTPMIAMTASVTRADRSAARAAGSSDFLSKPFTPAALHRLLLRWLPHPPAVGAQPRAAGTAGVVTPPGADRLLHRLAAIPGLEPLRGLPYAGQDPRRYASFLQRFVASARVDLASCRAALAAGDTAAARRALHSTKGSAAFAGAVGLRTRAADLEARIDASTRPADVTTELGEHAAEIERLGDAVEVALAPDASPHGAPAADATNVTNLTGESVAARGDDDGSAAQRSALLERLEDLLDHGDTAAAHLVAESRAMLDAALGEAVARLVRHVDRFEYEAAHELVRAAREARHA